MNTVRFRKRAEADLREIVQWYDTVAPHVTGAILADIYRSIDQLTAYPRSGEAVPGQSFRRIVTRKYRYRIVYAIAPRQIVVIGIFRHQDRNQ
jgi:plasmid stabilization system protein ParE